MPITLRDFDGGHGVFIKGSGVITDAEYGGNMTAHLSDDIEKLRGYAWSLSDYSGATGIEISPATLERVAGLCAAASEQGVNPVVAVVVPSDVAFGLSRMFEALATFTGWRIRTFRSLDDAVQWIRESVGDTYCRDLQETV